MTTNGAFLREKTIIDKTRCFAARERCKIVSVFQHLIHKLRPVPTVLFVCLFFRKCIAKNKT